MNPAPTRATGEVEGQTGVEAHANGEVGLKQVIDAKHGVCTDAETSEAEEPEETGMCASAVIRGQQVVSRQRNATKQVIDFEIRGEEQRADRNLQARAFPWIEGVISKVDDANLERLSLRWRGCQTEERDQCNQPFFHVFPPSSLEFATALILA
ncbi:MAG: hypothetical protein HC933_03340 [Pleurocapsa sp. SU_196_0]|nr:hypothetical protein [Pleurocapsa sp. SU_196_0]